MKIYYFIPHLKAFFNEPIFQKTDSISIRHENHNRMTWYLWKNLNVQCLATTNDTVSFNITYSPKVRPGPVVSLLQGGTSRSFCQICELDCV